MKSNIRERIKQNRILYTVISLVVFVALMLLGTFTLGPTIVKTIEDPMHFREIVEKEGILGYLIFIGIQILQVIFAFIPGEVVEVGAGYAFGIIGGTLLCLIGVAISSAAIFFLVRRFGSNLAEIFMDTKTIKRLSFLHDSKKLNIFLFLLYFLPGTPKDILTYFAGLTPVKPIPFLLICTFARIPSIITSTIAGNYLMENNYKMTVIVFVVTALLAAVGYFVYQKISNRSDKDK